MAHAAMVVLIVTAALLPQKIQTDRSHIAHIHKNLATGGQIHVLDLVEAGSDGRWARDGGHGKGRSGGGGGSALWREAHPAARAKGKQSSRETRPGGTRRPEVHPHRPPQALVAGRRGRRWRLDPASRRPDPASDGRETVASGGRDADTRPPTSWRPDLVGEVGKALAAGSGFLEARSGARRSGGGSVRWPGRGSTSPDLVETGSGGGGVWQSVGEALAAGRRGRRWWRDVGGGGGCGRRERWRREVGRRQK
uniref:Uncharacterized protein n=1 Tax=Oryza glumipatula TaxID=40148 RepID=A0A0E0AX78_9ORYZ